MTQGNADRSTDGNLSEFPTGSHRGQRREGGSVNRRDLQMLAGGWDKCVKSLRYEDGSPVEIVESTNPYRKMLEGLDVKEDT